MPTQTRYFTHVSQTTNGYTGYLLSSSPDPNLACYVITGDYLNTPQTVQIGVRVYIRHSDTTEEEVTSGTPVAIYSTAGYTLAAVCTASPYVSGTWACPSRALVATDAIRVEVWTKTGTNPWVKTSTYDWITEQLGAQSLDAATWTIWYIFEQHNVPPQYRPEYAFPYDSLEDTFQADNFSFTPWAPPPAAHVAYSDGFVCVLT